MRRTKRNTALNCLAILVASILTTGCAGRGAPAISENPLTPEQVMAKYGSAVSRPMNGVKSGQQTKSLPPIPIDPALLKAGKTEVMPASYSDSK